ncbi:MAG: hypothetical protein DMG57_42135 [Acidobacteria bacterium]|nr:MAG: hypothetical protein DMG57_42135 [Acidobacteriota bacterium]
MAVGVDITLSGAYVALADLTSRVVRRTLVPWNPSYELFFERIHRAIQGMVESLSPKQVLGVGIGLPGYIDRATGSVRAAENFNWFGVEAGRLLRKRLPFPGRHLDRIIRDEGRLRADSDIEGLRKRLAIDQLRVAISRPTERLLWLDINPSDQIIRQSIAFLNAGDVESGVSSCVPAALLKTLEEDELDPEERVQRCQADARQFLQVKPDMA